jgi:hypothetical protein
MTRAGQSKINERIEAMRLLAIEQKAACLSLLDRSAELESMLAAAAGSTRETGLRFHFAIALARQGQILRASPRISPRGAWLTAFCSTGLVNWPSRATTAQYRT